MQEQKNDEIKETPIATAPRHAGKVTIKKKPDFNERELAKQIEAVKLWSTRVLKQQMKSERISEDMKKAIETELKNRPAQD